MNDLQNIQVKIKNLQDKMHKLINEKENLLATEVIYISQMLDKILNEYYQAKNQN